MQSAQGEFRSILKRAKAEGVNTSLLMQALAELSVDPDQRQVEQRQLAHYRQWLGMPMGTQADLFPTDHASQKAHDEWNETIAEDEGYLAGRAGRDRDSSRFAAGSPLHAAWDRGYLRGQEAIAQEMGPDVQPKTGRRGRKGNAEDGRPEPEEDEEDEDGRPVPPPQPAIPARRGRGRPARS